VLAKTAATYFDDYNLENFFPFVGYTKGELLGYSPDGIPEERSGISSQFIMPCCKFVKVKKREHRLKARADVSLLPVIFLFILISKHQ